MPRWRNRQTRMPQKHEVPGSNPGWGTRFFARANALVLCSFTTRMWQRSPRRAARDPRRPSMGRAAGWRGFPSPMPIQLRPGTPLLSRCSAAAGARRSGRRGRRFESCRRDHPFLCSSADNRARGYDPRGQGFDSLQGCQPRRRISEERVPACRSGARGFKSRRRRHLCFRRVAQLRESSRLLPGRLQVQLLPRRPMPCSVSSVGRAPVLQAGGRWLDPITEYHDASQADLVTAPV